MASPLSHFRERKLVQWALAYAAGGFVIFEAIEILAGPWGISNSTQRGAHIALVAGFFITESQLRPGPPGPRRAVAPG